MVNKCKKEFNNDDTKSFYLTTDIPQIKADLTLSLDVIYHLVNDYAYNGYMHQLFESSNQFVIIYSTNSDQTNSPAVHIKNHKFSDWVDNHRPDFSLLTKINNKYPYNGDNTVSSPCDFYIYQKNDSSFAQL